MTDAGPPAAAEASLSPTHVLGVRRRVIGGIVPVTGDKPDGHCQFMMLLLLLLLLLQKAAAKSSSSSSSSSICREQHSNKTT